MTPREFSRMLGSAGAIGDAYGNRVFSVLLLLATGFWFGLRDYRLWSIVFQFLVMLSGCIGMELWIINTFGGIGIFQILGILFVVWGLAQFMGGGSMEISHATGQASGNDWVGIIIAVVIVQTCMWYQIRKMAGGGLSIRSLFKWPSDWFYRVNRSDAHPVRARDIQIHANLTLTVFPTTTHPRFKESRYAINGLNVKRLAKRYAYHEIETAIGTVLLDHNYTEVVVTPRNEKDPVTGFPIANFDVFGGGSRDADSFYGELGPLTAKMLPKVRRQFPHLRNEQSAHGDPEEVCQES